MTTLPSNASSSDPQGLLFLTPSIRLLGARRSLLELVENLGNRWKPFVVCSGKGGLQVHLEDKGIEYAVVHHYAWRKGWYAGARITQSWRIATLLDQLNPSVIHCNEFHSLPQAVWGGRILRLRHRKVSPPIVAHIRLGITPRQIRTYGLSRAARIVTVSKAVASLFDGFPSLQDRIRVVYNGVDLNKFTPPDPEIRRRARETFGFRDDEFVVGLIGLIAPRKRQHIAIEALRRLREKCPRMRLVFAGESFGSTQDYERSLREKVAQKNLGTHVTFLGFRDPVQEVYASLDLNLLISEEEGFGRAIIEAGAMGVPSIGTRTGGIPELIEEDRTGHLINLDDIDRLTELLEAAYRSPERIWAQRDATRSHVLQKFSIEAHVHAMESVWEEVLREKGTQKP